jgi:hypothetical protein
MDEHVDSADSGFFDINVRRGAISGEHVEVVDDALAEVTVQVVTGSDGALGPDNLAGGFNPVAFGVVHAFNEHGSMHGEIEAVDGKGGFEKVEEFGFERLIGGVFYGATGDRSGVECRDEVVGVAVEELERWRLAESGSTEDAEIRDAGADAAVSAAFGVDAAEGDAFAHGWNFLVYAGL